MTTVKVTIKNTAVRRRARQTVSEDAQWIQQGVFVCVCVCAKGLQCVLIAEKMCV